MTSLRGNESIDRADRVVLLDPVFKAVRQQTWTDDACPQ
jgi:hypothetical protein